MIDVAADGATQRGGRLGSIPTGRRVHIDDAVTSHETD
jgi:hypothetical protein